MKNIFLIIFISLFLLLTKVSASIENKIIDNLISTNNLSFNFEQNINDKTETGSCIVSYPKKIFCKYNLSNKKTLTSNGKSIVIKTSSSYYLYPIERTPLNFILDKNYIINKINKLSPRVIDKKFINYKLIENEIEINIFFDYDNLNLIGWQTVDIYQNLSITFLSSVIKNQQLNNNLFRLPKQN